MNEEDDFRRRREMSDGGPAKDMTLRDLFAMAAMAAFIAEPNDKGEPSVTCIISDNSQADWFASVSYCMADAMLSARDPKEPS